MPAKRKTSSVAVSDVKVAKVEAAGSETPGSASGGDGPGGATQLQASCQPGYMVRLHEAYNIVMASVIFAGIMSEKPITISQAAFCQERLDDALKAKVGLKACGNIFWTDFMWLANHRVPTNEKDVKLIMSKNFPLDNLPSAFPWDVVIGVDSPDYNIMAHQGSLRALTPEEHRHAYLFQCAHALTIGMDPAVIRQLRDIGLNTTMIFELSSPGEAEFWKARNLRETLIESGEQVKRTTRQEIYDVVGFKVDTEKSMGGKLSSAAVAKKYAANVKYARTSTPVSDSFVDSALTIHKRIFSVPTANDVLVYADEYFTIKSEHPFSSVYVLQAIIDRCPERDGHVKLVWAMEGLLDSFLNGFINKSHLSVASLKDARQSYVQVLHFKMAVRDWFLETFINEVVHLDHVKQKLKRVFSDFKSVRDNITPLSINGSPVKVIDTTYQASWPPSCAMISDLMDELCFNKDFDCRYKDAIKGRLLVQDFVDYPSVNSRLEEIRAKVKEEKDEAAAAEVAQKKAAAGVINSIWPNQPCHWAINSIWPNQPCHWAINSVWPIQPHIKRN